MDQKRKKQRNLLKKEGKISFASCKLYVAYMWPLSGYLGFNKQANTFRSPHENVTQNVIGQQRDLREVCMTRYLLIFRPKGRPPPLCQGLDDRPPPPPSHSLIWRSGSTTRLFLWGPPPPLYVRAWMIAAPPTPSSEGLDPPLGCFCDTIPCLWFKVI